jgi:Carboxypeptidase regulatory-like domain
MGIRPVSGRDRRRYIGRQIARFSAAVVFFTEYTQAVPTSGNWDEPGRQYQLPSIVVSCTDPTSVCKRTGAHVRVLLIAAAAILICVLPVLAQSQPAAPASSPNPSPNVAPQAASSSAFQQPDNQATGSIVGKVVDQRGTPVYGAHVTLARSGASSPLSADTDQDGQYSFSNVAPGPFQLSITAPDFKPATVSDVLKPGEYHTLSAIALVLAPVVTQVVVKPESVIAQEQVKQEEQQRVLGVVPNFYVTYLPDPAPLDSHQKFQLAWKSTVDPVTFGLVAAIAGMEQLDGQYAGFGTGAEGYAKRYGASYADLTIGTFLGSAILPAVFKQDPRFFYKANGSVRQRLYYALAAAVICKGDNGRWQPNYSSILGSLGAGAISNLYYPPQDRNGAALTFESAAIGVGAAAAANVIQEFVIPKLTFKLPFSHHQQDP